MKHLVFNNDINSYKPFYKQIHWDHVEEKENDFNEVFLYLAVNCRANSINLSKVHDLIILKQFEQGRNIGESKIISVNFNKYVENQKISRRKKRSIRSFFINYLDKTKKVAKNINSHDILDEIWHECLKKDKSKATEISLWKQCQSCFNDLYFSGESFFADLKTLTRQLKNTEIIVDIDKMLNDNNWCFWKEVRNCFAHSRGKIGNKIKLFETDFSNKYVIIDDKNDQELINNKITGIEHRIFLCDNVFNVFPQDIWKIYNFLNEKSKKIYEIYKKFS